jgi:hypothetical protein
MKVKAKKNPRKIQEKSKKKIHVLSLHPSGSFYP